jgi:type II secretion system protein N
MIHKILPWLAGAAWGTLVFLGGMQLFFPSDAAVERLQYEVDRASDGGWQLSADEAGLWRATGMKLEGVELLKVASKRTTRRSDDDESEAPSATRFMVADHVALRARLLPLLSGSREVSFDADMYRGDLSGAAGLKGDLLGTDGEASELDLSLFPFDGETISMDLSGALDLSWDLIIDTADTTKSTGEIALEVEGLELNSATVAGFDLEESSSFSKAELLLEIEDGKAKVKKGELIGDLIEAKIDGEITLSKKFDRSRLRLKVEFTLAEHIDNLVKLLPGAKDARRDDGRYHYTVSGTILHPSFKAERERRASSRTGRSTQPSEAGPGIIPGGLGGADDDDEDADERRRLREERIRERRERLRERREEAQAEREIEDDDPMDDEDFEDDEDFLDDERDDFIDERPIPVDRNFDDVELMDAPFDDDDLGEFEDDF